MRILAIITGDYGRRHADNIRQHAPAGWQVEIWQAPTTLPPFIDYPEDYVPARSAAGRSGAGLSGAQGRGRADP